MRIRLAVLAGFAAATLSAPPAQAQSAADIGRAILNDSVSGFSAKDRREIEEWFKLGRRVLSGEDDRKGHKQKKTPPGLAKRDELPPG